MVVAGSGRLLVLLAVIAGTVPAASAESDDWNPDGCIIDGRRGIVDCSKKDSGSTEKDDNFWTGPVAQTFYAILGLGASGGAAFFGWTRVRQQRKTLHQVLRDVEETYATTKTDPQAGIERLNGIRAELVTRHRHGKIEDGHFLELDRKIADYTSRLRIIDFEHRFPSLPADLMGEIRHLAQDGHLSDADIQRIDRRATALRLPVHVRHDVIEYLRLWAQTEPRGARAEIAVAGPAEGQSG